MFYEPNINLMGKKNVFSSFRGDPELIKLVRTMKLIIVFLMVSVSALFANVAAQDMKLDLR